MINFVKIIWFVSTLMVAFYSLYNDAFSVLVAYIFFSFIGLFAIWTKDKTIVSIYITIFSIGTIVAILLYLLFQYEYGVPYYLGGSDDLHYEKKGLEFANSFSILDYSEIRKSIVLPWHNSVGYIYIIGLMAKFSQFFGGFDTMLPRLFNVLCLSLISVLIYKFSIILGLKKIRAIYTSILGFCFPVMIWNSVQTYRDVIASLILLYIVYIWLLYYKGMFKYGTVILFFISTLLLIPLIEIRFTQAMAAVILMFIYLISTKKLHKKNYSLVAFLTIFLVIIISVSPLIFSDETSVFNIAVVLNSYSELRNEFAQTGLSSIIFSTPLFPFGWLLRFSYALITPLPIIFTPIDNVFLSFGTIVQIFFLPYLFIGIKNSFKVVGLSHITYAFFALFIGMSLFTFTTRHMVQYLPFAVILTSLGYEKYMGSRSYLFALVFLSILSFFALYIILKYLI